MQTPSPTKASARACTALVSTEVAKLLHKLQGQIIKEATAPREAAPGEVFLAPPKYSGFRFRDGGIALSLTIGSPSSAYVRMQRNYLGKPDRPYTEVGQWYGHESRVAADGERWERSLPYHVVNDFGDLVEVPA